MTREVEAMWPEGSPPCCLLDPAAVPDACRPYYVANVGGRWVLEDVLGHIRSVQTPPQLVPVYRIRQYSHRRAAFLKRDLLRPEELVHLPRYPRRSEDYQTWPNADSVHLDLLYDPAGQLYEEFHGLWGD